VTRPLTPSQRQRLRTPANLWRALVPLLVIVGVTVLVVWPRGATSDGVHVIDATSKIAAARAQSGFGVLAPAGLDPRWRPTNSDLVPRGPSNGATFRIGYYTPAGKYAEFLEGDDAADAVAASYGPLTSENTVAINGVSWDALRRSDGRRLLRHTFATSTPPVTVLVTGSAGADELATLAGSMH
jgi:hypothetical protein